MHPLVYYSLLELNNTELQGAGRLLDVIALVCTSAVKSKTSTLCRDVYRKTGKTWILLQTSMLTCQHLKTEEERTFRTQTKPHTETPMKFKICQPLAAFI